MLSPAVERLPNPGQPFSGVQSLMVLGNDYVSESLKIQNNCALTAFPSMFVF